MEMMSGMMKGMSKQMMGMSYFLEKGLVPTKDMKRLRDKMRQMQKISFMRPRVKLFRLHLKNIKGGTMISKILVPTDGSKTAQKAAKYGVDLGKQLKASVIVLSVIDQRSFIGRAVPAAETARHVIEPIEDYLREAAEGYAGEIKKMCDKNGVQSKTVITKGHPVEEIVKEAKKSKADLIVMGSHGRSALAAAVLGSVAYGVMHKDTKIPVLVVKR